MSNTSRSSIDLGQSPARNAHLSTLDTAVKHTRTLQHSPSLPNIWFPPHSGPIPRNMSKAESPREQRPSAPPSPEPSSPPVNSDKEARPGHVRYASIDPILHNTLRPKTHARRRTERDQPHSLITPPLTPSSSIQTTASRDSSNANAQPSSERGDATINEDIQDPDSESTRILLLGNVNRQISMEGLKSVVVNALLASASEGSTDFDNSKSLILSLLRHDPLKGVNERHLVSRGIIPIIFFDVRVAKFAKDVLETKNLVSLRECVGDEIDDSGERRWLTVRLVDLDELSKSLGYSSFLDGVDGLFTLTVQRVNYTANDSDSEDTPTSESFTKFATSEIKIDPEGTSLSRGGVNVTTLQSVLKSFGTIRFFNFIRQEVGQDGKPALVYNVEYHDSREAAAAFQELGTQVMFGMKIVVFGRMASPTLPTPTGPLPSNIPFPNSSTAGESFGGLTIGAAGSQSHIRQRFNYPVKDEIPARGQGDRDNSSTRPPFQGFRIPGGATSPTCFYTTPCVEAGNDAQVHAAGGVAPGTPQTLSAHQYPPFEDRQWDSDIIYRSNSISPCYTPDGICLYCPSRGSAPTMSAYNPGFGHYAASPLTPAPIYYPTPPNNAHIPGVINVTPIPAHGAFTYEQCVDPQSQPISNAGAWGFDPAIAAVAGGPSTLVPLVAMAPSPAPFFLREDAAPGRLYHAAYRPDQVYHQQQRLTDPAPGHAESPTPFAQISTAESSPSSYRSTSLVRYDPSNSAANAAASGQHERNQLNLARIEEGVDTRTTVMIKNIPNKMSDEDLTLYIGKVCPRRIDFLYLRMDFKNGCNVGYAFVNFINVEDLLHFAKERLGAKWNMFSSEKVLQMSYANYQGKEALIEKFKNSAIMDERESWRPRIFYSAGNNQGLIEPFPAPTHIRRKERSSYNRGTLFPPGTNSHSHSHGGMLNNMTARRYNDDHGNINGVQQTRPRFGERLPSHLRSTRTPPEEEDSRHRDTSDRSFYRNSTYRAMR
ncbi:hypothetical protein GALMADRAFT_226457 [Galerina marginata CBS 339.88]|uniref:RRM domain-containing protein n=1 Tax=Galerina marginata (strain CBS 339.88) TaxID=685588 RepID=A0A067SY31_GALM3|nr:hypothetical protein GALMADRAFT_226457 [Galerina marginata CBS 339.88]